MQFKKTTLEGLCLIVSNPFKDDRGYFERYYCEEQFKEIGFNKKWKQLNVSQNLKQGTLRGMHFQDQPSQEHKMVKCVSGSVYDIVVDIRQNSPTYLQHYAVKLSVNDFIALYIPPGFAHGFQCLEDNCIMIYHHSAPYQKELDKGLRYDDPKLKLKFPLPISLISERDRQHQLIDEKFKGY